MIVDFHTHTTESDGLLSPEALVATIRRAGIDYFSVTDHDTTAAYEQHTDAFAPIARRVIVGMEISTHWDGKDVHLLAYGIPAGPSPLRALIGDREALRWRRVDTILAALNVLGVALSHDAVRRHTGGRIVSRAHVARALVEGKYARDTRDAFERFLGVGAPAYVPSTWLTPRDAIRGVRESAGVAVLAHPSRAGAATLVEELASFGLGGLEVFYGDHTPAEVEHYKQVAAHFRLVMTAGSDFHEPIAQRPAPGCDVEEEDIEAFLKLVS
jgi:predicted metal-dependent phosphoesterase TrpH